SQRWIARRPQKGPEGTEWKLGAEISRPVPHGCRAEARDVGPIVLDVPLPGGRASRVTERPRGTLGPSWPMVWMLREERCSSEDPFVSGLRLSLDASHELEHSTCSTLLRQVRPVRKGDEPEHFPFGPARVESILCPWSVPCGPAFGPREPPNAPAGPAHEHPETVEPRPVAYLLDEAVLHPLGEDVA